jgi:hypothetical protein
MIGVSFIKRGADPVDSEEFVLFVEAPAEVGFAELLELVRGCRPKGCEFYSSWVCETQEDFSG